VSGPDRTVSAGPPTTDLAGAAEQTDIALTLRPTVPAPRTATPPLLTSTPAPPTTPRGPQLVAVPNVVGARVEAAIGILRARGFGTNIVAAPIGRPGQANRVMLQSPSAGQPAPRGSVVTLIIAAGIQPR
jgi:hypothetical protein